MTNLILIDSRVPGVDDILSSLTSNTESLVFDYSVDTFESIEARIQKPYESVVIAQHNYGMPTFQMLMAMEPASITDVANVDPELESWKGFTGLLQWLKQNGANSVDFLACNLWSNLNWVYAIEKMRSKLDLTIRASVDITGIDGNFVLESDNVDMVGIYFTSDILKYKYNFYTNSTPDSPNGFLGYTPIVFKESSPGYIPANAYNSIFGSIISSDTPSNINLTSDISNVAMVSMTRGAVAVLKFDGRVVAFGDPNFGANTSVVASNLYNITKIISTQNWFAALRSDGRVFSWGGGQYRSGVDINNWTNNGDSSVLLSGVVSSNLVNVADIYSNQGACFGLTQSGALYGWGTSWANTDYVQLNSGIVKVITGDSYTFAIKNTGVAYLFRGLDMYTSSGSNPIVDAYICNNAVICIRDASLNTKQITKLDNSIIFYTIPAGVSIIRVESYNLGIYFLVLLSNNVLLKIELSTCTVINNVTDLATTQSSYAYLQNGTVVVGGTNASMGNSLTDATYGLPYGASLTNVRRLVSSSTAIGALKYDNTFVWWGSVNVPYLSSYSSATFPTQYPTLYNAVSSNISSVYGGYQGFVLTKLDGSIVVFGPRNWIGYYNGPLSATTTYGTKRSGKNVCFIPNYNGFFAVENTPTSSYSLSQYMDGVPTTVTYYNNNPDFMALRGRKYSLMNGSTSVATWICLKDSFTFLFDNVVFTQGGTLNLSIRDITNSITSSIATFGVNVTSSSVISAPIINSVSGGDNSITVAFTPGDNSVVSHYEYAFVTNDQVGSFAIAPSNTSPITINGLTNANNYQVVLRAVSAIGTSSSSSNSSSSITTGTVPTKPVITSLQSVNGTTTVSWMTPSINDSAITSVLYNVSGGAFNSSSYVSAGTTDSSFNIPGLMSQIKYDVRVIVANSYGQSSPSLMSSVTPVSAPNAPTITSVVPGTTSANIYFTPGSTNGSTPIGYKYSLDGTTYQWAKENTSPITVNGLNNTTSYTVYLKSVGQCVGDSSAVSVNVTPLLLPSAPTNVVVTPFDESAVITFTDGSSNGEPIQYYLYSLSGDIDTPVRKRPDGTLKIYGLTNAVTYSIRLRAVNSRGASGYSTVSNTFITFGNPLVAPVVTSILPGNACAYVYFSAVNTNGSPLTKFKWSDGMRTYDLSGTTSPLTIPGLVNKKAVSIKIASCNIMGDSPFSTPISVMPGVPLAPVITEIIGGTSSGTLNVYFNAPESNGSSIVSYSYMLSSSTKATVIASAVSPLVIPKLTNGTPYTIAISANNANGSSALSNYVGPRVPFTTPAKVVITSVTPLIDGASVAFTAPANNGSQLLKYKYALNSGGFADVTGMTLPLRIYGINPNTTNTIKIIATNAAGDSIESAPSKAFTFVYLPPLAPTISSIASGNASAVVTFTGQPSRGAPITGYAYTLDASATTIYDLSGTVSSPLTVTGLTNNVSYNVRIAAITPAGYSAWSAAKPVTPVYKVPDKPVIMTVTAGSGQLSVAFTAPAANGSPITGYQYTLNGGSKNTANIVQGKIVITGLTNGTVYNVQICATNALGDSELSIAKAGTPKA